MIILKVDGRKYKLESQIIKKSREIIYITPESNVELYVRRHIIEEVCDYPINNSLYIMLLSGNLVKYGDEGRTKQEHVATIQVYKGVLDTNIYGDFYVVDLKNIVEEYKKYYSFDRPNNLFVTTSALRDYHYLKQKNNAYYHIRAINLPFQNIEFYYIDKEFKNE